MGGAVTEEQAISHAQYLDLAYYQSCTLYDLIPHAPRTTTDPSRPTTEPHADRILGLVQTQTATPSNQLAPSAKTTPSPVASTEVNVIQ